MRPRPGRRIDFPTCPFCEAVVQRPEEGPGRAMPGGECSCGAAYAMDATGLMMGEALLEALAQVSGGNPDVGWQLDPSEDYEERQVLGYDPNRHVVVGSAATFRSGMAALCFVRLREGGLERARARLAER